MANLDRGAYDQDKLHDFEADQMDDDSEKSRLPLLVLIALVVLAAFGGVVWLAYTQGVERGRADAPRVIVAQSSPTPPKSASSPYAGLNIYQPSSQAAAGSENADTIPPPPTTLATTNRASAPPPLRPSAAANQELPPTATTQPAPAETPSRAVQQSSAPAVVPKKQEDAHALPSQELAAAPDTTNPPQVVTSGVRLQIGSYKSDSEAMQSWSAFKAKHAIAAPYQPDVQKVDLGVKGTWYRLRLGALADKKSAVALCEKLRAQGASCLVAR